ncbi:hypothetical protein K474DRAFT_1669251 [Panus rudis PR-1116 ss-1]|nr:hypothetical protein K474DRAFT_1669251 [Panus rudis PR-1116 ss-1]
MTWRRTPWLNTSAAANRATVAYGAPAAADVHAFTASLHTQTPPRVPAFVRVPVRHFSGAPRLSSLGDLSNTPSEVDT